MKLTTCIKSALLTLALACGLAAQTPVSPSQWAGGGLLYNNGVNANGLFVYAHRLSDNTMPTYSFNAIRITGWEGNPLQPLATKFKLLTTQETGVGQYLKTFGGFNIYAFGLFGSSQTVKPDGTGIDIGTSVTAGGMASKSLGRGWSVNPVLCWNKPSVAPVNQWSLGLLFGWGK